MSKHKSIARTIIVFKGREIVYSKEPGRGGYKYLNMQEIYCSCGYRGSTGINFIGDYYKMEDGKEDKEKACYETNAICPNCGKKAEITLSFNEYKATNKTDLTKIWDNGNKISFHACYTSYFYNKEVDKLGAKKNKIALTFNVETGIMYFMKNKG